MGNNSSVKFAGPTTIVQAGVDVLAEDNSTIDFGPHSRDGILDASGWNLGDPANHTKVELHSTRACLVANKNSIINMYNLGDYGAFWESKYNANQDYLTATLNTSSFCYAGYMQFYANPFVSYSDNPGLANNQATYPGTQLVSPGSNARTYGGFSRAPITPPAVSGLSYGGMCVRAVGDSQVNVKNVVFPCGWENASGPVYSLSAPGQCSQLRIWNIADNSELHASYLTVGNDISTGGPKHPQDLSGYYYGPSAVWTSSLTTVGLSGAPSSTPDTSSLSVLDSFGRGVQTGGALGYYGKTEQENIGPFRLYVSPDPKAKFLAYPVDANGQHYMPNIDYTSPGDFNSMGFNFAGDVFSLQEGEPYQLFAQGYATSSDCSALNSQGPNYTNTSAVYQDLGFSGYIGTLPNNHQTRYVASSFFYTSAMLPHDSASRIWLDESAINTFANAKNGILSTSGRKKIFSYYKAETVYPGEAQVPTQNQGGGGAGPVWAGSANLFDLDRDL
mgnify:FL=1